MVQLSKRLQMVAGMVTYGNRVADIGCDHAHTSIYLIQKHISDTVIAMDINQGPIDRAIENVKLYRCEDQILIRRSDGAKELLPDEADTMLISGMGGGLTIRILEESSTVVKQIKELILQPQSEISKVRKYLHSHGFLIASESMLLEDGKYYIAIRAVKGQEQYSKEVFYKYSRNLLEEKTPILYEYLKRKEEKYKRIIVELCTSEYDRNKKRLNELEQEMNLIREALHFYALEEM